jgi:hypothetical protein
MAFCGQDQQGGSAGPPAYSATGTASQSPAGIARVIALLNLHQPERAKKPSRIVGQHPESFKDSGCFESRQGPRIKLGHFASGLPNRGLAAC